MAAVSPSPGYKAANAVTTLVLSTTSLLLGNKLHKLIFTERRERLAAEMCKKIFLAPLYSWGYR